MSVNDLELQSVINASGKMSILGVSTMSDEVTEAMKEGAQSFYVMEDLRKKAGKKVAQYIKSEAAMITNSASSAIVLAVSGLLTKDDTRLIHHLEERAMTSQNEIIIMTGHNIDYGAPVKTMVQMAGAHVSFAGYANGCSLKQIEDAISERTLGMVYVQSHHCVQKNMPALADISQLMEQHNIPFIIDAAAETDIAAFSHLGDMCIISGSKALAGPTSGILAGKERYIEYATYHESGIGRAMKVGKESITGLLKALEQYPSQTNNENRQLDILQQLQTIDTLPGVTSLLIKDDSRNIYRLRLTIDAKLCGKDAPTIVQQLKKGDVAIYTRDYHASEGSFDIDPRALTETDGHYIFSRLEQIIRS